MNHQVGRYIILIGVAVVLIGIIIFFFGNAFRWMGKLPGDIRIEREHSRFYFPITTMLIISIILTIIVNLLRKWL